MWPRNDGSVDVADALGRRRAGLGELAGDAADLHDGHAERVGQHDRHLQDDAQLLADVVGGERPRSSRRSRRPGAGTRCRRRRGPSAGLQRRGPRRRTPAAGSRRSCFSARRARACVGPVGLLRGRTVAPRDGCPRIEHSTQVARKSAIARRSGRRQPGRQGPPAARPARRPRSRARAGPRPCAGRAWAGPSARSGSRRRSRSASGTSAPSDRGVRVVDDRPRRVGRDLGHRPDRPAGHAARSNSAIHSATVRVANSACRRGTSSARSATRPALVA